MVVTSSNTAYATIACKVIAPIGITKVKDMSFGNIMQGSKGSISLSPDGERTVSTGTVSMQTSAGIISAAVFEVNDGVTNTAKEQHSMTGYTITLPQNEVTLMSENGKTMRVRDFVSNGNSAGNGTFVEGKSTLNVGATLYVEADVTVGNYASAAPFPVTVNFN